MTRRTIGLLVTLAFSVLLVGRGRRGGFKTLDSHGGRV
jgi:hypothetical protein